MGIFQLQWSAENVGYLVAKSNVKELLKHYKCMINQCPIQRKNLTAKCAVERGRIKVVRSLGNCHKMSKQQMVSWKHGISILVIASEEDFYWVTYIIDLDSNKRFSVPLDIFVCFPVLSFTLLLNESPWCVMKTYKAKDLKFSVKLILIFKSLCLTHQKNSCQLSAVVW